MLRLDLFISTSTYSDYERHNETPDSHMGGAYNARREQ